MKMWFLILLLSSNIFADESIFDGTDPMTDQELQESETYIHQGKAERIYKDQCVDENGIISTICSNDTSAFGKDVAKGEKKSTMQSLEEMMPMVTMAYSNFSAMLPIKYVDKKNGGPIYTDGKSEFTKQKNGSYANKDGQVIDPKGNKDVDKKTKDGQDYCGIIPQVGSTAVTFYEQTMDKKNQQNFDNSNPQTKQSASFLSLAKAHKDRAKTAKIQMGIWGATGACYAGMMLTNTISANVGAIVKTGAAGFLAYYFNLKKKAHEEKAALLEQMASQYPGAGDCNPITATTCFCNEETSPMSDPSNYQDKCVPKSYHKNFANNSFICIDANKKADPACDCKKTGSCIDAAFKTMGMQIGLNPSMMKDPLAGIAPLSNGFGTNGLDNITDKNLAFMKKAMKKIKPENLNNLNLNNKQKKLAKSFAKAGIPGSFAAVMAKSANGSSTAPSIATSGLGRSGIGLSGKGMKTAMQKARKIKYGKAGGSRRKKRRGSTSGSRFGRFRKKGRKGVSGVQIMNFAAKAQREAEISKDTSKPIFDIITYRYKASAWREFKDQINKHIEQEKTQK